MPRVTHVKKARKDNKAQGIKKGQEYWWWGVMCGGRGHKRYSLTKPKQSQLTNSEFWGAVYSLQEEVAGECPDLDDIEGRVDDIKSQLEDLASETDDKFNNMPDGLQQGDTGQLLEERSAAINDCVSELDSIDFSFDEEDVEVPKGEDKEEVLAAAKQARAEEIWGEVTGALDNISCS